MHQAVFERANVIAVHTKPDPTPAAGEIRVRVKASGVNFADMLMRLGIYPEAPPFPNVAGYEVSGIVDAVGANVSEALVGKAVVGITYFNGYSDTVVAPAAQFIEKPASVSFIEAASIPVVYLTAYMLLIHMGSLRKGQTVLIHNAGSGVGLAAIDLANHIGAIAIGTASASKHAFLRTKGFAQLIDYRSEKWEERVLDLTNGKGVDLIIDPIGGRDSWLRNFKSLRKGGRLGFFGASTMHERIKSSKGIFGYIWAWVQIAFEMVLQAPSWSPLKLMDENKAVFGVNLAKLISDIEYPIQWLKEIFEGIDEGWIHPHIDSVFEITNVAGAHKRVEERKSLGKVVLVPDAKDPVHDQSRYNFIFEV
ncbi:hypothetical protein HK100_003697 [Physocladia obscura]|uniref:Enoyl reductase (ER) domain-containing protein n=1 Tax=Physocladia obscura TaxID=109957 RepID=A0AAD5XD19_9FUNG|nr:hypothetical protein HK100_003697 [Physocladia obscura]